MVQIRAVSETDDFESIYNLINDTLQRFSGTKRGVYGVKAEELKKQYCDSGPQSQGFIAKNDNDTVAFMGFFTNRTTKNAYVECGFLEDHEHVLDELLDNCITAVKKNGGTRVYKYTPVKFGQVRNKGISLWEKLGFTSDEYAFITTTLKLENWNESDPFDATGIEPATDMKIDEIKQILLEDGEDSMAELFKNQYSSKNTPDQVILTLKDKSSNDILAIAYYRVNLNKWSEDKEFLEASSFGIHIRPQYSLDRGEIRRFVQGSLVSMKQLNIENVYSHITLKNFDVFAAMITEGFHNQYLNKANTMRLCKNI